MRINELIQINLIFARPGGGKSSYTAYVIEALFGEYKKTEKRYPSLPQRFIFANLKLNEDIEKAELNKHLRYWTSPNQLRFCPIEDCFKSKEKHALHDCDLIIDEVANYLPADGWAETPRWLRKLFSQHRHRGIRVFANTQDYKAVDINFRRMVRRAELVEPWFKSRDISATLPPVKWIYGIIKVRAFPPEQLEEKGANNTDALDEIQPPMFSLSWFWLGRRLVEMYDTQQDLPEYMPSKMEEVIYECEHGASCKDPRHRYKIIHRIIG